MMNKMTNLVAVNFVLENCDLPTEVREKIEKIRDSFAKKSESKKPTANQTANIGLKEAIVASMVFGEKYTVTDVMKNCDALADMSNQKVSALIRQLVLDGTVVREEIKRKAYFSLNEEA